MKRQPAYISPVWFFTKIGMICVLGVIVGVQVYSMFWKPTPVPQVARVTVTPTKPVVKQPKQAQAKKVDTQDASPKQSEKPSLTQALLDPETYTAVKADYARRLDAHYGKLYRELGLDNNTLQKLRGLLAEKELRLVEGQRLAKEAGTPLSNESLAALRGESDGTIRELLGEKVFADYKYYESTLHLRNHADYLERWLSYKTEPLTSEQYNAFVSALAELPESTIDSDRGAWMGDRGTPMTEKTLEVASNILTPSQFAVYAREYETLLILKKIAKEDANKAAPSKKKAGTNTKK